MIVSGNEVKEDKKVSADVCIVGSGAGGAVLAMKLSDSGKNVVVLEKGGHYEKENFDQREADMIPKLWKNSGLQFSRDFSFHFQAIHPSNASCTSNRARIKACFIPERSNRSAPSPQAH